VRDEPPAPPLTDGAGVLFELRGHRGIGVLAGPVLTR
jgi:hypothetical protein